MHKYWVFFLANFQKLFEYRVDTFIFAISNIVTPLISLGLWLAVAVSGAKLSFSSSDIIIYQDLRN